MIFFYISFKYETTNPLLPKKIYMKEFTTLKPLRDPHVCFDFQEMEFLLSGQWDIWLKPIFEDNVFIGVEKIVNCYEAAENSYQELYIVLSKFYSPSEPDDILLPIIYKTHSAATF